MINSAMKKTPTTPPASPATTPAEPGAIKFNAPSSLNGASLSTETLLALGAIYADQQVVLMMGEGDEAKQARGVIAGLVIALHEILPPPQFRDVMIQWEVDAIALSQILELTRNSETIEA